MARIFLTHTSDMRQNYYGERAVAGLAALGDLRTHEGAEPLAGAALVDAAAGCEVIVSDRQTPGETSLFEQSPALVAFCRCAVDIRTVDVDAASRNGILVSNASPGFVDAVSELVIGFMVDLARGISSYVADYRVGRERRVSVGRQLAGATLGVIGYGAIGRRVAELGRLLRMTVLVSDPHKTIAEAGIEQVPLQDLLARADFVVCLAVATEETENLLGADAFKAMQRSALFINVSRGNLVDEEALEAALREGLIAGAAMDVGRAPDQMPSPRLAQLPNVLATPHIGGLTPSAIEAQALETVEQVSRIVTGQVPHNAVNAQSASRLARLSDN